MSWTFSPLLPAAADLLSGGGPTTFPGYIKVWDGATWAYKPMKVWDGATWTIKPVKYYSGATWITTSGI